MLNSRIRSFGYAFNGLAHLFKSQVNARIHLVAAIVVMALAWLCNVSTIEWCLLLLCIGLVIAAEAINTSLEALTDLASPDYHPLAKKTKDLSAAGVLILAIAAAIIGLIILGPPLANMVME